MSIPLGILECVAQFTLYCKAVEEGRTRFELCPSDLKDQKWNIINNNKSNEETNRKVNEETNRKDRRRRASWKV